GAAPTRPPCRVATTTDASKCCGSTSPATAARDCCPSTGTTGSPPSTPVSCASATRNDAPTAARATSSDWSVPTDRFGERSHARFSNRAYKALLLPQSCSRKAEKRNIASVWGCEPPRRDALRVSAKDLNIEREPDDRGRRRQGPGRTAPG